MHKKTTDTLIKHIPDSVMTSQNKPELKKKKN